VSPGQPKSRTKRRREREKAAPEARIPATVFRNFRIIPFFFLFLLSGVIESLTNSSTWFLMSSSVVENLTLNVSRPLGLERGTAATIGILQGVGGSEVLFPNSTKKSGWGKNIALIFLASSSEIFSFATASRLERIPAIVRFGEPTRRMFSSAR